MKTTLLLTESLRTMTRYKLRSAFMMLATLVGVAALTLVVSVGTGAEQKILNTVQRLFSASSIMVGSGGNLLMPGPRAAGARMSLDDLEAVAAALPAIEVYDPLQSMDDAPVRFGDMATTARVVGSSERAERVWERSVSQGEFFDAGDVSRASRVALVGETVVRKLFAENDPLGAEILVGSVSFRVVGVLERMGTDAHGLDRDNEVVVPISTAMRRLLNVDTIRGAKFLTREPSQVAETVRELKHILRERHALGPDQPDDFTVVTPVEVQAMVKRVQRVLFIFLPLVSLVALLAGGAVSATLMRISVSERTSEIGIRRAVGARPRDIAQQFLVETAVTTLSGGVIGVLVGFVGAVLVARRLDLQEFFSWKAALLGLALSVVTGIVAGVSPARRAAGQRPADALR